ncbi:MAG: hypothetical protein HC842_03045 [Cytophagales bacterium]|nr:hypothetical protein [Cytophagales bacterium]
MNRNDFLNRIFSVAFFIGLLLVLFSQLGASQQERLVLDAPRHILSFIK